MRTLPSLKHNVFANFIGKGWETVVNLLVIPLYLNLMGAEAYGLIGVYAALVGFFLVLDMGLSATLNRQLAHLSIMSGKNQEAHDLVKTLEYVYWGIGIVVGLLVFFLAPFIARYWVNPEGLGVEVVYQTVLIMGLTLAVQWPTSLYLGGLMGLQRQVLLNVVRAIFVTAQHGGALLVLLFLSATVKAFFQWQLAVVLLQTLVLAVLLHKSLLPSPVKARFDKSLLKKNWEFAAGMTGISVVVILLTQMDKIVLSKMLPLEVFGYYTLAFNVANALMFLVAPITTALFPRFSQMVAGCESSLSALYHFSCQALAVILLPAAMTLAFFSKEVLLIWLGDLRAVDQTYLLLSLFTVGTAFNGLMALPYNLQLAHGWTRLSLVKNVIALVLIAPLLIVLVIEFGALGGAIVWILLNLGYFLLEIPVMHRKILRGEMSHWYVQDTLLPMSVAALLTALSRWCYPSTLDPLMVVFWIVGTFLISSVCTAWISRVFHSSNFRILNSW